MNRSKIEEKLHNTESELHTLEEDLFWQTEELNARNAELRAQAELLIKRKAELDQANAEAEQGRKQAEQLISSIGSALIGLDMDKCVAQWNVMAEQIFGILLDEVHGRAFQECGIGWRWPVLLKSIDKCITADTTTHLEDFPYNRPDGNPGFLNLAINLIRSADGQKHGIVIIVQETTERRRLASQLAQAQKMESIGQLSAGIAHEINTPIQFISDNTRFLQEAFAEMSQLTGVCRELISEIDAGTGGVPQAALDRMRAAADQVDLEYLNSEIPTAIEQTLEGIGRVSKIVLAMKQYSHPGEEEKYSIDLNKSIESTIIVCRSEWKYVADLETDFDMDLQHVYCCPSEINQVILNMIVNAAHAIKDALAKRNDQEKGRIKIVTRAAGKNVEIRIEDSGAGIAEEIRSRIFDPFFTTKEVGKGTGQGLAIAHSVIVKNHGGEIAVESIPGEGSTFIIRIPFDPGVPADSPGDEKRPDIQ